MGHPQVLIIAPREQMPIRRSDGPMTHQDGYDREMAKWAHQRLDAARRRAEEEQRHALADSTNHPAAQPDNSEPWIATWIATAPNSRVSTVVRPRSRNLPDVLEQGTGGHSRTPSTTLGQVVAGSDPVSPTFVSPTIESYMSCANNASADRTHVRCGPTLSLIVTSHGQVPRTDERTVQCPVVDIGGEKLRAAKRAPRAEHARRCEG
jgi:hypothetical protein